MKSCPLVQAKTAWFYSTYQPPAWYREGPMSHAGCAGSIAARNASIHIAVRYITRRVNLREPSISPPTRRRRSRRCHLHRPAPR